VTFPIHAELDAQAFDQADELRSGEPAALEPALAFRFTLAGRRQAQDRARGFVRR